MAGIRCCGNTALSGALASGLPPGVCRRATRRPDVRCSMCGSMLWRECGGLSTVFAHGFEAGVEPAVCVPPAPQSDQPSRGVSADMLVASRPG